MRNIIAARPRPTQSVDRVLADVIFFAALQRGIQDVDSAIRFEYTAMDVPECGRDIYAMYEEALGTDSTFKVFNGANDGALLYFSPQTNLAYRALHDVDHAREYRNGRGTTKLADELYLNCLMAKRVYMYAINNGYTEAQALMTFFAVYADTVGQVHYYRDNNDFCVDQRANTELLLSECEGIKALTEGGVVLARLIMIGHLNTCGVHWGEL
jgi:hypothetical protein